MTYLNTAEAGAILNAHPATVIKMIENGAIPERYVYKAGREYRIHPDAFQPDKPAQPKTKAVAIPAVLETYRSLRNQINLWEAELLEGLGAIKEGEPDGNS